MKTIGYVVLLAGAVLFIVGLALTFHHMLIFMLLVGGAATGAVGYYIARKQPKFDFHG